VANYFTTWIKRPFSQDMDAAHWIMFIGLFLMIMIMWRYVLDHIIGGID
jgi:hypothetical protein